ncbi:hypothetical protein [Salinibacterium sp. M195]|uniref:hypothetical protein n=1 Tax=Salinibacterium sp. M195 TaxID=2583374 RepID=UPI001C629472|nr:hypothetical protein [Salinibacterium sp. M195]QYH34981.1 hypothetical protein FFT87_02895 [Salinibacterium sp. M195]
MKRLLRKPLNRALRGTLLVSPALLLLVGVFTADSVVTWLILAAALTLLFVIIFGCGVSIKANDDAIVIGFFPFYRKRLSRDSIARVYADKVRPFEEFGGWGVKGSARKNGLLLSAGEAQVVGFELVDGRKYLVGAGDATPHVISLLGSSPST